MNDSGTALRFRRGEKTEIRDSAWLKTVKIILWSAAFVSIPGAAWFLFRPGYGGLLLGEYSCYVAMAGIALSIGTLCYFLLQSVLAWRYRRAAVLEDGELPTCTVIVPAFNEGRYVATALASIRETDYPAEKLEIIAIDDGSSDDTWEWICRAADAAAGAIRTLRLPENGGKRHALYVGFGMASGEVVVTVDSDSAVSPDALRELVSPLRDGRVGAVAGNIRVSNRQEGVIPRMMDVAFTFGFEFMRAAQSRIHAVLCTPGALSAYRLAAVRPVAAEWARQTFMGAPCGIGEDRSLTSLLIRNGWHTLYQASAVACTKMPVTCPMLFRMLIRWCRSDVRENLLLFRHYSRNPGRWTRYTPGLLLNLVFQSVGFILPVFFIPMMLFALLFYPFTFFGYTVVFCLVWSVIPATVYAMRYEKSEAVWAFAFGLFSIPFLSWVSVYSLFTVRNSGWLTRGASAPAARPERESANSPG